MLKACVAALTWFSVAHIVSGAIVDSHSLRLHSHNSHTNKELTTLLGTIEERLRLLETISAVQIKQARRIDLIQEKLDRVETTISLKLERAQLAADRLEHRLHMLQSKVEVVIKDSSAKLEKSQTKISGIMQNLTNHLDSHRHLLEKVSGAYAETWRRGLVLESLMRDSLTLTNATRRECADSLRNLARRQRDPRLHGTDLESTFSKLLNENNLSVDLKMQEVLDAQKRLVDSCQRVQLDPPQVTDMLDKLIDSLINKTATTFRELQNIHTTMRLHDTRVMKILNTRGGQNDGSCKRLESIFKNSTHTFKENELQQLTEKFVALTDRADSTLQKLESRLNDDPGVIQKSDVTLEADKLFKSLESINNENESQRTEDYDDDEEDFFDDSGGADIMEEDQLILNNADVKAYTVTTIAPSLHRRHLHKHPYDRGPKKSSTI